MIPAFKSILPRFADPLPDCCPGERTRAASGIAQRPLRICLLSYRSNPHCGGQGVYIKNLSRALKDLGHQVEVIAGPPDPLLDMDVPIHRLPGLDLYNPHDLFRLPSLSELGRFINLIEWLGVSSMGFPEPLTFSLRAYLFLRDRLQDYDIVHDNQCLAYGSWAIGQRKPTVATIHHPITVDRRIAVHTETNAWRKLKQLRWYSFIGMQKQVARSLSHLITVSKCSRKDISQAFGIPASRFRIIPNGIDTRLFRPLTGIVRETGRVMVTNSADMPLKGLTYLLMAAARIHASGRRIHLVVIGTPQKNGRVEKLLRSLGIGHMVTFTGRVDQSALSAHYARAAMAVVPSVYEGFGLPAGEAMACRVPVIATTGGALPEVVGQAGLLVPPANAEALASAMLRLLDHPRMAQQLAEAGYRRVRQHFTWPRAAQKTVALYLDAIDAHGGL